MKISRCLVRTAATVLAGTLTACGGGGGGGGSAPASEELQYRGNSNPAVITTSNASALVANAMGGSDVAAATSSLSGASQAHAGQGQIDIGRRLVRAVRATVTRPDGGSRLSSVPIDQTDPCPNGGTVRVAGDVSQNGTGTVAVIYTNCAIGGDVMNGGAAMRIDAFNLGLLVPTDMTITFSRLAVRGASNTDIAGSVRVLTNLAGNSETVTENVVALYPDTARMTKSENLVFIDVYDNVLAPTSFSESISGRVFDSVHGFVDIMTVTPLVFATLNQAFPSSGQLILTGAANARVRATGSSATRLTLELDLNNDGTFEVTARLLWVDLGGAAGADLGDTDGDGMHNSWETAYGLNPNLNDAGNDPDNDGFTNIAEYQAGTRPNVPDATLPPPPNPGPLPAGPVTGLQIVLADNSDIVYDSVTDRIYAAVRTDPGSVVPINPASGALGTPIPVGKHPVKLALSDNGQFLYVGFEASSSGFSAVQRINLATQAVDLAIPLGSSQFNGPNFAEDIHVLPGRPGSFAVSLRNLGFSPRHEGVAIYDGALRRAQTTPGHTGSNVIEFSATAATLYGYNNETTEFGFRRMAVDGNGVTVTDVYDSFQPGGPLITGGFSVDMRFGGGFLFTTTGQMIDPIGRVQVAHPTPGNTGPTFALPGTFGFPAPDAALGRVFYLVNDAGTWSIKAFDMGSRVEIGSGIPSNIASVNGMPGNLIRWGPKGLAFRTSAGQIYVVQSTSWIP